MIGIVVMLGIWLATTWLAFFTRTFDRWGGCTWLAVSTSLAGQIDDTWHLWVYIAVELALVAVVMFWCRPRTRLGFFNTIFFQWFGVRLMEVLVILPDGSRKHERWKLDWGWWPLAGWSLNRRKQLGET